MSTRIAIDDALVNEALKLGHLKNKRDVINTTLREFIDRRKRLELIELFGQFEPDPDYDYKQGRKLK